MAKEQQGTGIQPSRLPLNSKVATKYNLDMSKWQVLCNTIFPAAKSAEAIRMALEYCQARKLDVFKRPVHIVPMWSSVENAMVETVWPGISELRTTAFRTGQFGGMEQTEFGPTITKKFAGEETYWENRVKKSRKVEVEMAFPEWARINVYRLVNGERQLWVGPTVHWLETYAKAGRHSSAPNAMWQQRPFGQLEKCAEAATLRRAFPEEFSNEYSAEEMEGGVWAGRGVIIEHDDAAPTPQQSKQKAAPPNSFELGRNARENGMDFDAAPDGMPTDEYKQWVAGWRERDNELTVEEEVTPAKTEEPAKQEQETLDLKGSDLTDFELELHDAINAALDEADLVEIEKRYHGAKSGDISNAQMVEDWFTEKRNILKGIRT